jgi:methionyl-tRNA formyltransferase
MKPYKHPAKILLMGTPALAADVFEALIVEGYHIIGIVSQPDKIVGKSSTPTFTPTKEVALKYNIPVYQPIKIRENYQFLADLEIDYILTLAYGQIVPQQVLDAPRFGAFNLHGSLLPALRGASPIRYSLINGDTLTGMTLMKMTLAMDAGDMYAVAPLSIDQTDTYSTLLKKFSPFTIRFILDQLPRLLAGELIGIPQDVSKVTFAPLIKKEHEHLSLTLPIDSFVGWIKGLADEPGGYVLDETKKIKLFQAHRFDTSTHHPIGTLLLQNQLVLLQCIDGLLAIDRLQMEGKSIVNASSFYHGYRHYHGRILR